MHSITKDTVGATPGRWTACLVVVLVLASLAPVMPAQGDGVGFLVFRDTVPVGPDLDAGFHSVVPDGVTVVRADLHLFGTQGILPVSADTSLGGGHVHNLTSAGLHSHGLSPSEGHNHTVTPSGEHDHRVTVYSSTVDTFDAKMSVDLPPHNHTFNSATLTVDPFDFGPVTSNGHNHTARPHSHNTLIGQGGVHEHTTDVGGDHNHDVPSTGDHVHVAGVVGAHNHSLVPGWTGVDDGSRPSAVTISVTVDTVTTDLPGTFGTPDADWDESIDVTSYIGAGVSAFTLTADTHGMLEYVLVVEIDHPYGVISGQDVMGPGGSVEVPIWVPVTTLSASAYLFGSDLSMAGTLVETGGNHTHDAVAAGEHVHPVQESLGHNHLATGGAHEHEGYTSSATPGTTSTTPLWNLAGHRHGLTWSGQTLTGIGNYGYGTEESEDHEHRVVDHDHSVTINVSGAHDHNISTDDVHVHVDGPDGNHTHVCSMSMDHSHPVVFSPISIDTGGPVGVTARLDGTDITSANGGPWDLDDNPTVLDIDPPSWSDMVTLSLSSQSDGGVEWVVLVEFADPVVMVSVHGVAGEVLAHVPVPTVTGGAKVGTLGTPYVMPFDDLTDKGGVHGHVTSSEGNHTHITSTEGNHTHDLESGGLHVHGLVLDDTVVTVLDANGTVDLGPHTHTVTLGAQTTSLNGVTSSTGTHAHLTDPHVHDLNFTAGGNHVHLVSFAGNHSHEMALNGSHAHTMEGGEHDHGLRAGVTYSEAFPSPIDVDVQLGDTHPGERLDGGGATWWEEFNVGGGHIDQMSMEALTASSGQVGSLSLVVWFLMDLEPPAPTLEYAPAWVAPGDTFPVVVGVPDDIDTGSVSLEIGPVVVDGMEYNASNGTIEFTCTAPLDATEGSYDIDLTASDNVGNEATTTLGTLGIDGTPPTVTVTIGEPQVPGPGFTWVTSGTPVNMTIEDATSGPDRLEYAFSEAGPWTEYVPASNTVFDGRFEGESTLFVKGVDIAGNWAETQSIDVNIDDTGLGVSIRVLPSVPGDTANEVVASPDSVISFLVHNDVGVPGGTIYYQIDGQNLEPIREYDRPFPVSSVKVGITGTFTITWYGTDPLGNIADGSEELTVKIDPVAPIPSPEGDLFLPTHVTESPVTLQGNIPGNVAVFHYRIDGASGSMVDMQAGTTFDFIVDLVEGPNTLLYALESPVGVVSPWVVGGVIVLDTEAPELTAVDPAVGSRDLRTSDLSVALHFSEPVNLTSALVEVNGKEVQVAWQMHGQRTSATLWFEKDPPGNALIEVEVAFEDLAGNDASDNWSYKTRTPSTGTDLTGVILGLVAGLIIGVTLMFFATFKRKEPSAIVHEGGVTTTSIISPDEDMSWHEEQDDVGEGEEELGEGEDEEELDEVEEEQELDEEREDIDDEADGVDEDEGETETREEAEESMDLPEDWDEGDVPEEAPVPEDGVPEGTSSTDQELEDLENEIDRLLDEATSGEGIDTEDLPDPEDETVDPGSRF